MQNEPTGADEGSSASQVDGAFVHTIHDRAVTCGCAGFVSPRLWAGRTPETVQNVGNQFRIRLPVGCFVTALDARPRHLSPTLGCCGETPATEKTCSWPSGCIWQLRSVMERDMEKLEPTPHASSPVPCPWTCATRRRSGPRTQSSPLLGSHRQRPVQNRCLHTRAHSRTTHDRQEGGAPTCPSIDEWINTTWSIHIVEYYPALKKQ